MKNRFYLVCATISLLAYSTAEDLSPRIGPLTKGKIAYESERIENLKQLITIPSQRDRLVSVLVDEPESAWKNEVILALLEVPWLSDRQPGKPAPPGIPPPLKSFQLAIELLSSKLPDESLKINDVETYKKLSTLDGRKLLVAKFNEVCLAEKSKIRK